MADKPVFVLRSIKGYRVTAPMPPGSPKPYGIRSFPRSRYPSWRAALDAALAHEAEALAALPADDPGLSAMTD